MFVYSKKIVQFLNEIKDAIKIILSREVNLQVHGGRFYDRAKEHSYPIKVVIYNARNMLGYFDPNFYELGFHECLMHANTTELHNIIKHELAHYITFINYGERALPHGAEFKAFCQRMGWGEEIYKASTCLEGGQNAFGLEESSVFRKVQKLMALANSNNTHEAEQAMIKSQQLLLKHNIESKYLDAENEEKIYLKRIMKQKQRNAKMRSIGHILGTFFVSTVYNRGENFTYLEILGNAVNVEIAEHVAAILDTELDKLWKNAQQHSKLKGAIAKNSFFLGIAKGYCNKIQALKRDYSKDIKNALLVIEKKLVDAQAMAYNHLATSKSNAHYCMESSALGEQVGRQLSINPALNGTPKHSGMQLTHAE